MYRTMQYAIRIRWSVEELGTVTEKPLKSAFELAMERLKEKDAAAGVQTRPLTDEQKAAIAEARSFYDAKIAEIEVLHQSKIRRVADPEARALLEQDFRRDRDRLVSDRDARILRIRERRE
jgi:hypothetical protein